MSVACHDETNTSLGDFPGTDFLHLYVEGWRSRKARRRPIHQSVAAVMTRSTSSPGAQDAARSWPAIAAGNDQSIMFWS